MEKYVVSLSVQLEIEAVNASVAETKAWAERGALLQRAQAKDIMSVRVVRLA